MTSPPKKKQIKVYLFDESPVFRGISFRISKRAPNAIERVYFWSKETPRCGVFSFLGQNTCISVYL